MQAEMFYSTDAENSLPIVLMSKVDYAQHLDDLSEFEQNCLTTQQFKGGLGDVAMISNVDGMAVKAYMGMGDDSQAKAIAHGATQLPVGNYHIKQPLSKTAQLAWSLAQYQFDQYKTAKASPSVLLVEKDSLSSVLAEASAVFLVRDLINRPTNDLGPEQLAEVFSNLAHEHGAEFQQWVGDELLANNFPAIYTVGRAAAAAPRLLSLCWGNESHPRVTLVGKGVCFDTGGLDIKPPVAMRLMKKDMGGAAHVIGLAQWLMAYKLPIRLQVLIPAVENSIGTHSYRPGDVLTMRNGLTVEVDNTDAEGRLVLADALVKACEDKPEVLFNFATLTGAARVAVGTEMAAMFTNNDALAQAIITTANEVDDPVWRMPLFPGYANMLDSAIADLANGSASPYAGAITAALFLQRFIDGQIPWAHFDIMAWNVTSKPGKPEGGEAMAMRAVAHYLFHRYG
ncbi:leucyl aminopeptidase family protein [Legionella nagasakiensis]|uniref:leucyl aminopeptidase family protein n=1 Tax=Legionella nagasakiensis TaxID=535290 RepID=UPI0010559EE4|nr:leucyl aminopeptidase family protein [Legionella nagasakiensis]